MHLNPFAASLEKMKIEAIPAPSLGQNPTPKKLQKHVIIYIRGIGEKRTWPNFQVSITLRSFDSAFGMDYFCIAWMTYFNYYYYYPRLEDSLTPYNATPFLADSVHPFFGGNYNGSIDEI